jgi:hypothetical protein
VASTSKQPATVRAPAKRPKPAKPRKPRPVDRRPGRMPKNYKGPLTKDRRIICGQNGCVHSFSRLDTMMRHRKRNPDYHADLLSVYLPHYLVFKTDIVISVNAIMTGANIKDKLLRM